MENRIPIPIPIDESREKLIKLFKFEAQQKGPFLLSYEFRKKGSGYEKDKELLRQLMVEKLVVIVEKTTCKILYRYIGK